MIGTSDSKLNTNKPGGDVNRVVAGVRRNEGWRK